jgi:hypothetical protein
MRVKKQSRPSRLQSFSYSEKNCGLGMTTQLHRLPFVEDRRARRYQFAQLAKADFARLGPVVRLELQDPER